MGELTALKIAVWHGCFIIETLDKKATPLDTKFFHSNGPNYDPSNTSVLVDGPFCTDRFDTVPALSISTMSTGINDVHLWRYRSILDVALACKSTG